jgi:hypothetical protein
MLLVQLDRLRDGGPQQAGGQHGLRIEQADGVDELVFEHVIGRDAARHAELACALDGAAPEVITARAV